MKRIILLALFFTLPVFAAQTMPTSDCSCHFDSAEGHWVTKIRRDGPYECLFDCHAQCGSKASCEVSFTVLGQKRTRQYSSNISQNKQRVDINKTLPETDNCKCRFNPNTNIWDTDTRPGYRCIFNCSVCNADSLRCQVSYQRQGYPRNRNYCKYTNYGNDCGQSVLGGQ